MPEEPVGETYPVDERPVKRLVPQPHGGAIYQGAPANVVPGSGRPKDEWKKALQAMASADDTLKHVRKVIEAGAEHPHFFKALDYITEHGYGKATQGISLEDLPTSKLLELLK